MRTGNPGGHRQAFKFLHCGIHALVRGAWTLICGGRPNGIHAARHHNDQHNGRLAMLGALIKGRSDVIVRDGKLDEEAASRNRLSERDLLEDLRLHGNLADVREVALAVFERNGQISVVRRTPS